MNNKQTKKATVDAINVMISHADKGLSGFWVEDHEGCGNPAVFPEFEEGLKQGGLVQKEHYFCPWNTAIMYGDGHGNIITGCYHSCSIDKVRYLSAQELKEILARFKTRMENGDYDCVDHLSPLLTKAESRHIEDRILAEQHERERCERQKRQDRLKKAAALIAKYPDEESLLAIYYGEKDCVLDEGRTILFDPAPQRNVVGAEKFSYNDYLDVQFASLGKKHRPYFADCFFNSVMSHFKGQIEKVNPKHICFKRIFISGMYTDGTMFDGKEDHVWMEKSGFEECDVGDSVSFCAEVYRYVKTGNGKLIDYGLRNPTGIQKIEAYELPSDDELIMQEVEQLICETCFLSEQCNRNYCTMDPKKKRLLKQEMFRAIKAQTDKETQK